MSTYSMCTTTLDTKKLPNDSLVLANVGLFRHGNFTICISVVINEETIGIIEFTQLSGTCRLTLIVEKLARTNDFHIAESTLSVLLN